MDDGGFLILAVACRAITVSAGFVMLGLPTLLYIIAPGSQGVALASSEVLTWRQFHRYAQTTLWLAGAINLIAGMAWFLFTTAGLIGGPLSEICGSGVGLTVAGETTFGRALSLHAVFAVAFLGMLVIRHGPARFAGLLSLASVNTCVLAWVGHAVGPWGDTNLLPLAADLVHRLAAGFWLGAIAGFSLLLATSRRALPGEVHRLAYMVARNFSPLGIACVAALLTSGIIKSWLLVGDIPHLLGTDYGRLLMAKVGLFIIMVAAAVQNRRRWTPWLSAGGDFSYRGLAGLRRNCLVELTTGVAIVVAAAVLAGLTPAAHQEPIWPLSSRWDSDMLGQPGVAASVAVACTLTIVGIGLLVLSATQQRLRLLAGLGGLMLILVFLPTPMRLIAVPAYPTTFQDSPVPYEAASIADGWRLYRVNCVACHGADFRGSGEAGAALPVRPADLTAPHVLAHPPGDLFWWISNGIPGSGMPAFAKDMSETQRWDLVNFVRSLPVGGLTDGLDEEVRTIAPQAPDFPFEARLGQQEKLSDRLVKGHLLLVFLDNEPPERLAQLERANSAIEAAGLDLLAVTSDRRSGARALPFVALVDASVASAYGIMTRTGASPAAEFLIDHGGFARAAWRIDHLPDWSAPGVLSRLGYDLAVHPLRASARQHHH